MIPMNLLPKDYVGRFSWCIAGGWAACPALGQDRDVWVYGIDEEELVSHRNLLAAHARKTYGPVRVALSDETRQTAGYQQDNKPVTILKVADIRLSQSFDPKITAAPVHLMVTDALSPREILLGFDVSTHAIAINWNGDIYRHEQWTPVTQPPVMIYESKSGKTPGRMERICKRFGFCYDAVAKVATRG